MAATRISKQQVYHFLDKGGPDADDFRSFLAEFDDEECPLDEGQFNDLKAADLNNILVGSEMSENHLGGDDLISLADDVISAAEDGYKVYTWYGPESEALVFGLKPGKILITG